MVRSVVTTFGQSIEEMCNPVSTSLFNSLYRFKGFRTDVGLYQITRKTHLTLLVKTGTMWVMSSGTLVTFVQFVRQGI